MAKEYAFTVKLSTFNEKAAYNHDRPISGLIRTQLHHLHAVEQHLPPKERTNININDLHTERQASDYIQKVTALLHGSGQSAKRRTAGKGKARKKAAKKSGKKPGKSSGKKAAKTKKPTNKRR
jgi:hypothetical protein